MIPTYLETQIMLLQNANLKFDLFFSLVLSLLLGLSSREEENIELFLALNFFSSYLFFKTTDIIYRYKATDNES